MLEYKYLKTRGALHEATQQLPQVTAQQLNAVPRRLIEMVPEAVARAEQVFPLRLEGETFTLAAVRPDDIGLIDKLSFILNKKIRLLPAPREVLYGAINKHYGQTKSESVESLLREFSDTADLELCAEAEEEERLHDVVQSRPASLNYLGRVGKPLTPSGLLLKGMSPGDTKSSFADERMSFGDHSGGSGMFFYIVEEGQRVLMRRPNGTMEVIVGPRRVWRFRKQFTPMQHHVAHPGEFLLVRYRDGRQEHVPGPAEAWLDPRVHQSIGVQEGLQLAAKEAVVVYSKQPDSGVVTRRIVYGPAVFIPQPGEWLHTFSWHASKGGHQGAQKIPNGLVFQKLWLMPDQMYHDVTDVRTADDAVLTVRLMIFFELADIERMLDTTHDPIGDFVNAATSDVVAFTGRHDFESFKRNVTQLNELETYRQLASRAAQCGYRITKVVYRGYGAPQALQQMHDQAIEARTKLQLERATEQQAQDLEDYKLSSQIARSSKRRAEQSAEVEHDLELARRRHEADVRQRESLYAQHREQRRLEAEQALGLRQKQDGQQREHLTALRDLGVDLTAYLTQARADKVIELRGSTQGTHVHLEPTGERGNGQKV
jgi:hypothetical protein